MSQDGNAVPHCSTGALAGRAEAASPEVPPDPAQAVVVAADAIVMITVMAAARVDKDDLGLRGMRPPGPLGTCSMLLNAVVFARSVPDLRHIGP